MHQKGFSYALTNLWSGLCMFVLVIELLVNFFSPHLEAPTCPFTPEVLQAKERAPTRSPFVVFTFKLIVESIKELGGMSIPMCEL
jgi:hypothetical protein